MGPKRFSLGPDKPFEEFYRKAVCYTFVHFYFTSGQPWISRCKPRRESRSDFNRSKTKAFFLPLAATYDRFFSNIRESTSRSRLSAKNSSESRAISLLSDNIAESTRYEAYTLRNKSECLLSAPFRLNNRATGRVWGDVCLLLISEGITAGRKYWARINLLRTIVAPGGPRMEKIMLRAGRSWEVAK